MKLQTRRMVFAALLAAFTCISTMIIKFPTPTFGYVHLGDGLVLLCGVILGPLWGGFAAATGSMFADLFSGYAVWAPATFVIKGLCAFLSGLITRQLRARFSTPTLRRMRLLLGGIVAEAWMVIGYFLFEIMLCLAGTGSSASTSLHAAVVSSATGIPFNIMQGVVGIFISFLLVPVLEKIPQIRSLHGVQRH